jgi:hypothetical protein
MRDDSLHMWTIYRKPKDVPDAEYFVREQLVLSGRIQFAARGEPARTLEEARALVPQGKHRLPRHQDDDPVIVEVWL